MGSHEHDHSDDPHGYGHDEPEVAFKFGIFMICTVAALVAIALL